MKTNQKVMEAYNMRPQGKLWQADLRLLCGHTVTRTVPRKKPKLRACCDICPQGVR